MSTIGIATLSSETDDIRGRLNIPNRYHDFKTSSGDQAREVPGGTEGGGVRPLTIGDFNFFPKILDLL